jgi:hypothetical protein
VEEEMTSWDDLETALQKVRDALDDADGTSLGKIESLLDDMAKNMDIAISTAKRLREIEKAQ